MLKKWNVGLRFLHPSGRNAIVERGHRLLKVPVQWIRPAVAIDDVSDEVPKPSSAAMESEVTLIPPTSKEQSSSSTQIPEDRNISTRHESNLPLQHARWYFLRSNARSLFTRIR